VNGPNSLWHIDANLKLVRWGITVQGCIDGFSRVMVMAKVSTNNRAETVLQYFKEAEVQHGRPSRIRCDYGAENRRVAEYMLESRGLNRGSVLTGSSIRNQRIERFWYDCRRSVLKLFSRIFTTLEETIESLILPIRFVCFAYILFLYLAYNTLSMSL
jgi:hypothetical protein